ncbi:MAG: methyltransferase [Candidatus Aminicenantes bacterium]|jgi:protein-S-isoprenylcysteine O-methyltransferase Ste14
MFIGVAVSRVSWIVLLCAVLWIVFWQIVVPAEERALLEKYGDSCRQYMKRIPRIKHL